MEVLHAEILFPYLQELESQRGDYVSQTVRRGLTSNLSELRFYVLITPLLGSCLVRQGSSGRGSWAKTESSPDEQVLLES